MIAPIEEWHVMFANANVGGVTGTIGIFENLPTAQAWVATNQAQAGLCKLYKVTKDPWAIYDSPPTAPTGTTVPSATSNINHTKFG